MVLLYSRSVRTLASAEFARGLHDINQGRAALSHSHIPPINHLLKQVELHRARKQQRDNRPAWLTLFIDDVVDLFEPMSADVARVGFDARLEDEVWRVSLFLGTTEMVGGRNDGLNKFTNFEFNICGLLDQFKQLSEFSWTAIPEPDSDIVANAWLNAFGITTCDEPLRLEVFSVPPQYAGPGFHLFPNGVRRES